MDSDSNPNPKPVTVTYGHSSFIARSLVSALLKSSPNLTVRIADPHPSPSPDRDRILHFPTRFDDPSQLRAAIAGSAAVFHVDPTLGSPPPPLSDLFNTHKLVVGGARNVTRVCRECGVERLVYTGSADAVFDGMHDVEAGNEWMPYPDKFMDILNDLRTQAEMLILNANGRGGLSTCVLRPSNPFGPGDDYFVPFLVAKAKSTWAKFIIGSGKNMWDLTYVENIAHANICAEQALCSDTISVAGKPFFITNCETVNFWDFNSMILEGLGYQRPYLHLPAKLVLFLAKLVELPHVKLHGYRTYNLFLTPASIHALSCTRTVDSSRARTLIGYSPTVSLEDGITATVGSASQITKDLPYLRQRDFSKTSKAESALGNGIVADILLWRDEKRTFTYLVAFFLLYHWFLLSGRTFISSTAKLLLLVSVILFTQGALPSSLFGFNIEKVPSSYFEVSELAVRHSLITVASVWNNGLCILNSVAQGNNWNIFIKATGSLYLVKLLLSFTPSVWVAVGVICLFSLFIIYEQCEEEVDQIMTIAASSFKKLMELLSAKLSNFMATSVHSS